VVIGTANYPNANWSDVITLGGTSGNELTAVKIHQAVHSTQLDPSVTVQNVFDVVAENFDMKSIEDFKYLQDEQGITFWQSILIVLASIVISIIVSILFARNTIRSKP
jgi:ABC-type phosphate/phosphonate transport system permease subunit